MLCNYCNNPVRSCRNRIRDKNLSADIYLRGDCKNTSRKVEKWGRERKEVRQCVLSQAVTTVGNWISTRPGSSGISCTFRTSVSHSRRQGAGIFIHLPLVPALIISSLAFPAAWLVSRTVFGSVRKPLRKRNTGAGNKKLGQRTQKW